MKELLILLLPAIKVRFLIRTLMSQAFEPKREKCTYLPTYLPAYEFNELSTEETIVLRVGLYNSTLYANLFMCAIKHFVQHYLCGHYNGRRIVWYINRQHRIVQNECNSVTCLKRVVMKLMFSQHYEK